jgi:uncharacterized glyoxalase superfamily protein PhnB
MKVTGMVLWVQDNTLSVRLYKKLGFEVVASNERNSAIRLSNFEITLVSMRDEDEFNRDSLSGDKGRGAYLYIRVDDVDNKYNELQGTGVECRSEPRDWAWGNREFVVKDPDGYKIVFWQPSKIT